LSLLRRDATTEDLHMKKLVLAATFLLTSAAGLAQASVPTSVPDGGTTIGLLTGAMLGLGVLRMKFGK
jgi:hypothetical protein